MPKPTFNVKVLANNLQWASLSSKLASVAAFYYPVCVLSFQVVQTRLSPVFNASYPGLGGVSIVDEGWYDANIAEPHAGDADMVVFITPQSDHPGTVTFQGMMTQNNVGPWEITIFANGENDHVYMDGQDLGNSFVDYLEHEISHALYAYCGLRDDTHVHFPFNQDPYADKPENVLKDFDFSQKYPELEYLKEKLKQAMVLLSLMSKKPVMQVIDK